MTKRLTINWARSVYTPPLVLVCVALVGCADLGAIRTWAETSADATSYSAILDDYSASPDRQRRYQEGASAEVLDTIKDLREEQVRRLLALHTATTEYMRAIGQLAADDIVIYDKELDAFTKAVKARDWFDSQQADAYVGLAKVLFKAATDGWRQNRLKDLISESNADLQIVVGTMRDSIKKEVRDAVELENQVISNHFAKSLRRVSGARKESEALAATIQSKGQLDPSLKTQVVRALERNADGFEGVERIIVDVRTDHLAGTMRRTRALDEYDKILKNIADGHQALYDGRSDLDNKELLKNMIERANALRKAFGKVRNLS